MEHDFLHTTLGKTGVEVFRLGLSGTYRPGKQVVYTALDQGVNYFFCFGMDSQMIGALKDIGGRERQNIVIASGAGSWLFGYQNLRRALEHRLRQLRTDYIDIFLFLGAARERHFPEKAREELNQLKEDGKVRWVGMSTHDRKFAGRLATEGALDVFMVRYNAAHRGAEVDIFPHLAQHNPGIVSFTATRWSYLMRRPKDWPRDAIIPDAGQAYRFVLSNPNVHVCMTAPSNQEQLEHNLAAVRKGPLQEDEMEFIKKFGDAVRHTKKWFM